MDHNIYEFKETLIISGSCLKQMDNRAYEKLEEISQDIYNVCLEKIHMNMVAHKIASILRVGKVKNLIFASVDKSPHCIQLHYIRNELEKIMDLSDVKLINYVSNNGELKEISAETISKSKNLFELEKNL